MTPQSARLDSPGIRTKFDPSAHEQADRFRAAGQRKLNLFAKTKPGRGALYIYEPIGEDPWSGGGVTAAAVVDALASLTAAGVTALDIFINCEGGDVFEAKAIYANLCRFSGEKVVHVDGIAASAATFIAMAGDRIITSAAATWMVHKPWTVTVGDDAAHQATLDMLQREGTSIAQIYAKRTGRPLAEMLAVMDAETWMNAEEALEAGFTDEIDAGGADTAPPDETKTPRRAAARRSSSDSSRRSPPAAAQARGIAAELVARLAVHSMKSRTAVFARQSAAAGARLDRVKHQVNCDGYGTLHVCGGIGQSRADDVVTLALVAKRLDVLKAAHARSLLVTVDSPGGDAYAGFGIVNALRRWTTEVGPVVAFVDGRAASMGAAIAVAADFIVAAPWSEFFIHNTQGPDCAARVAFDAKMRAHLRARTLVDGTELDAWLAGSMWFTARAAAGQGFADELADCARAQELARAAARPGGLRLHAPQTVRQLVLSDRKHAAFARG